MFFEKVIYRCLLKVDVSIFIIYNDGMKNGLKRYLNPSGIVRWMVNVQIDGIRLRKQNFFTKKEASAFVERMRLLIITGNYQDHVETEKKKKFNKRGDVAFREFAETLFDSKRCKDIRSSTHRRYVIGLEKNVFPLIKSKSLRAIHGRDFEAVKEKMLSEGYARTTINQPLSAMMYVLRRAQSEGLIKEVPKNPVSFKVKKKNVFLTDDELRRLLRACDTKLSEKQQWFKVYVHLQLNTFARVGELLALNWSDIDFEKGTIAINKQVDMDTFKLGDTKNGRVHTALPLSDEMLKMLKQFKVHSGFVSVVFPNAHYFSKQNRAKNKRNLNIKRMRRGGVFHMLKKVAVLAGIAPERCCSHVLRKSAGDRLLRAGFSIHQVAHALRIDAKTVLWTYSTLDESAFETRLKNFSLLESGDDVAANDDVEILKVEKDEA